jgi:hypothetical protein
MFFSSFFYYGISHKLDSFNDLQNLYGFQKWLASQVHSFCALLTGGGPAFYRGVLKIENSQKSADTFISFRGWTKGVAFVNGFNLGRFWPSIGPQCTLYVPAPLLHSGDNELILLELESLTTATTPTVQFVNKGDFTCGIKSLLGR